MTKMTQFFAVAALVAMVPVMSVAQSGPYKVLRTEKVGGVGGFDYVNADEAGRGLYVARSGAPGHVSVFNLDTLASTGEIADVSGHGVVVDVKSGHGFVTSKPVTMFDLKTLAKIKTIEVQGSPDGMLADATAGRVYILSHSAPNVTVLDAKDGSIVGTLDLGGAPEQAVLDGKGRMYIDLEDKDSIAVVDTKALKLVTTYDLMGKGGTCAGLAMDVKNNILFAACRKPQMMVILNAGDGKIIETLPIGSGTDGAAFNPKTMEAFSSEGGGTLTVIQEKSPTSFVVEQTLVTVPRAKTMALDGKTGRILLIAAEFGEAPAPTTPGGRPGRAPMVPDSFKILEVGK